MAAQDQHTADVEEDFGALSSDVETGSEDGEDEQGKEITIPNISYRQLEAFKVVIRALLDHDVVQLYRWCDDTLTLTFKKDIG